MQQYPLMMTDEYDLPVELELDQPRGRAAPTGSRHAMFVAITCFALLIAIGGYWLTDSLLVPVAIMALIIVPLFVFEPFYGLCLLVCLSPFDHATGLVQGFTISKAIGIALVLAFLANTAMGRFRIRFPKVLFFLLGFLVWCAITSIWSPHPLRSALAVTSFLSMLVMLLIVCMTVRTQTHFTQLLKYVVIGAIMLSFYSIFATRTDYAVRSGRLELKKIDTNHLMNAIAFGALCTGYFLFSARRMIHRILLLALLMWFCVILLLGQSRGVMLACVISLVMAALLTLYRNPSRLMLVFIGIVLLISVTWIVGFEYFWTEYTQSRMNEMLTEKGSSGRIGIWRAALSVWSEHPFRGWGFESTRILLGHDMHNNYLMFLLETGIPGLALWLVMLLGFFLSAIRVKYPLVLRYFLLMNFFVALLVGVTLNTGIAKVMWYELAMILAASQLAGASGRKLDRPPQPAW